MVKVKSALFTLLTKSIAKKHTFKTRRTDYQIIMLTPPIPSYTRTEAQDRVRTAYKQCCDEWHTLTQEQKQTYEEKAKTLNLTAFNVFLSECIKDKLQAPSESLNGFSLQITEPWEE